MFVAADKGDITTIIGGIAPDWGPFGDLGNEARVMIEVVMAVAILLCLGIAIWGAAKQRIGATALRDTFSAEQGKGRYLKRPPFGPQFDAAMKRAADLQPTAVAR